MKLPVIEHQGYFAITASKILAGMEEAVYKTKFWYCWGRDHLTIGKVVVKGDPHFIGWTHSMSYKVATSRQLIIIISFLVAPIISLLSDCFEFSSYCLTGRWATNGSAQEAELSRELVAQSPDAIVSSDSLLQRASPRTCCTQATKRVLSERVVYFTERLVGLSRAFGGGDVRGAVASGDVREWRSRRGPCATTPVVPLSELASDCVLCAQCLYSGDSL